MEIAFYASTFWCSKTKITKEKHSQLDCLIIEKSFIQLVLTFGISHIYIVLLILTDKHFFFYNKLFKSYTLYQ